MRLMKSPVQFKRLFAMILVLGLLAGWVLAGANSDVFAAPSVPVAFTILHTNDFHGQLEPSGSNPGAASLAYAVNAVRTSVGADKVLLVDAGDSMQGSLLSNVYQGQPVVSVFNTMNYSATAVGNHDFDWGPMALANRIAEAGYPFLSANIVSGDPAGWTPAPGITPYVIKEIGVAPNQVKVAFIGVTTEETADLNPAATAGLTFKDPAASIGHYYAEMDALADVIVVLSHLGFNDGGYGYGFPVYGDKTLAQMLIDDGKPVDLILGGHSHTDVVTATLVGDTLVAQAHYNGRKVGRADITVGTDGSVDISWSRIIVDPLQSEAAIATLVSSFATDPTYLALINQTIAYTNVPIMRNYDGDSLMGAFINDALYNQLNNDAESANDVEIVFINAGNFRADITGGSYPADITYGALFTVLPFGNQTVVGELTGADIQELLDQSATLWKGALQVSGIRYDFYRYEDSEPGPQPFAWGAVNIMVMDKSDGLYKPLDLTRTYRVATNEFLAPAGGDGFQAFQNMTNITYWGDMLNLVNAWLMSAYPLVSPYNGTLDGRIAWDGVDAGVILGQAHAPIDGLKAYTEETNAANMQADAVVHKLLQEEIDVDFYLAGAVRNIRIAEGAAPATPYDLTARDLYTLMPYDYNIVVLRMNGPQIKAILERAFRNYYYYKYVPGYGGYQYYTTGMLDISSGCEITYLDDFPTAYNPGETHVISLKIAGNPIDFTDETTYYRVATLRHLALGGVNFNNGGVSLWPLSQIITDTPYHIRNAVIEFVNLQDPVLPAIENRLVFLNELPEPTLTPTPEATPTPEPTPTPTPTPTQDTQGTSDSVPVTGEAGGPYPGTPLIIGLLLITLSAALAVLIRHNRNLPQ